MILAAAVVISYISIHYSNTYITLFITLLIITLLIIIINSSLCICHSTMVTSFFSEQKTTKETKWEKTNGQTNPERCEFIL